MKTIMGIQKPDLNQLVSHKLRSFSWLLKLPSVLWSKENKIMAVCDFEVIHVKRCSCIKHYFHPNSWSDWLDKWTLSALQSRRITLHDKTHYWNQICVSQQLEFSVDLFTTVCNSICSPWISHISGPSVLSMGKSPECTEPSGRDEVKP